MTNTIQVITTTETKPDAQAIARALVEKRLAACVQIIGPITSTYWWKERIETAEEWLCMMKTDQRLYTEVVGRLKAIHPYETPEIVAMPIVAGSDDYLKWLRQELRET